MAIKNQIDSIPYGDPTPVYSKQSSRINSFIVEFYIMRDEWGGFMARRKSKAKQEEEFLNALVALVFFVPFLLVYFLTKSLSASIITGVAAFIVLVIILFMRVRQRQEKLKQSGIADIDQMNGFQFEKYLKHLFAFQGYKVTVTQAIGDYGADLVLKKNEKTIVVQAKRYSNSVGIDAVQQAVAAINHYHAQEAWVVTNSRFTEPAITLALSNNVKLIARDDLIEMILNMQGNKAPSPKNIIESTPHNEKKCDRCGSDMVLRKGPRGPFYGCSRFPKCRFTRQLNIEPTD